MKRLIEITPEDPIAWYNLAGVYEQLDNPQVSDYNTLDMAVQAYMKVLEFDPAHLESSFKLMDIAFTLKKSDMAVKIMEEAVEHSPDEPLAYYNLINTYEKCKMFEQAEAARQRLKQRFAETPPCLTAFLSQKEKSIMFGSLGFTELILILFIVLIIFGAGKLPQLGEGVGKAIKGFKKSVNEAEAIEHEAQHPAEQQSQAQVNPQASDVAPSPAPQNDQTVSPIQATEPAQTSKS